MAFQCSVGPLVLTLFAAASMTGCDPVSNTTPQDGEADRSGPPSTATRQASETLRVAAFFSDSRDPFQQAQAQFLQVLVSREPSAELQFHDALGNADLQRSALEALLSQPPEALIVLAVDPQAIAEALLQLRSSGTLVVGLDHRFADTRNDLGCSSAVYENPVHLGRTAGQFIHRSLSRKAEQDGKPEVSGRLAEIRGTDEAAFCTGIHQGLVQELAGTPGIILVHDAPAGWSAVGAAQRTADALRIQKHIDVLFAHSDEMARSAHQTAVQAGVREQMLIVGVNGFDGPDGGVEMIRHNEIDATLFRPLLVDFAWTMVRRHAAEPDFKPKANYQLSGRVIAPADLDRLRPENYPRWPEW